MYFTELDKYASFNYRLTHNFGFILLLFSMIFSIIVLIFFSIAVETYFFAVFVIFVIATFFLNLNIYKKRAKYYVANYVATNENIKFIYFDRDSEHTLKIAWTDLDFNFGRVKNDKFLIVWNKNKPVFTIFRTFGKQAEKLNELRELFLKYIPEQRIKKNKGIFANSNLQTKQYFIGMFN